MTARQALSREQIREIDRKAIEQIGMPGAVLMENAGRSAAEIVLDMLDDPIGSRVIVVCGPGNNGGDGFVVARHLHNARVSVIIYCAADPERLTGDAAIHYRIARNMGLELRPLWDADKLQDAAREFSKARVIVDGLLGTGFVGMVHKPIDRIIEAINQSGRPVAAIDVPSGLDCDTGLPSNATICASVTVTFVAPKLGFEAPGVRHYVGYVVVADIGVPRGLVPDAHVGGWPGTPQSC